MTENPTNRVETAKEIAEYYRQLVSPSLEDLEILILRYGEKIRFATEKREKDKWLGMPEKEADKLRLDPDVHEKLKSVGLLNLVIFLSRRAYSDGYSYGEVVGRKAGIVEGLERAAEIAEIGVDLAFEGVLKDMGNGNMPRIRCEAILKEIEKILTEAKKEGGE